MLKIFLKSYQNGSKLVSSKMSTTQFFCCIFINRMHILFSSLFFNYHSVSFKWFENWHKHNSKKKKITFQGCHTSLENWTASQLSFFQVALLFHFKSYSFYALNDMTQNLQIYTLNKTPWCLLFLLPVWAFSIKNEPR